MDLILNTESLRPPLTGIGNYTFNLLREMVNLPDIDAIDCFDGHLWRGGVEQLSVVTSESLQQRLPTVGIKGAAELRKLIRGIPIVYRMRAAMLNKGFRKKLGSFSGAIYHEPNFILKNYHGPSVVTVHDLSFLHYPQYHPQERVAWLSRELPKSIRRADFVITDSELVRTELMERYQLPEDRTRAIYLGADDTFYPRSLDQINRDIATYELGGKGYILFVGTLEPRKGLGVLLDAWLLLPEIMRRRFPIVIVGASGWRNTELLSRIKILKETEGLRYLEYVPLDKLPALYSAATICVNPSIYEGFGLPVLEAMACGTPVICGDGTSMAEFAAGACLLCEVSNAEDLSNNIEDLLNDDVLLNKFATKGLLRAGDFSWQRCAKETIDVYGHFFG
jgi:glycosyltransferase involved in cell wall biosynthesis